MFLYNVNTACDKYKKMFFVSYFMINMYLLRFCFSKLLYILYVRSIFILYSSVLHVDSRTLKKYSRLLLLLRFCFVMFNICTRNIQNTSSSRTFQFFFRKMYWKNVVRSIFSSSVIKDVDVYLFCTLLIRNFCIKMSIVELYTVPELKDTV